MGSENLYSETLCIFQDSQDILSSDSFLEVLKQFLKSGRFTERCQLDLNQAVADFSKASSLVWQHRECSMNLQGVCGDKVKVSHQHIYSVEEFCDTRLEVCVGCGKIAVSASKLLADGVFDSSVAVSRVEVELLSFLNQQKSGGNQAFPLKRVYQILGVLYKLLRTCAPDDHFAEIIIKWIYVFTMNSVLLPGDEQASNHGRMLTLIHIIRVHNAFLSKLIPLVQPPFLKADSLDEAFDKFQPLYFAMLTAIVSRADDRGQFLCFAKTAASFVSEQQKSPDSDKFVFVDEFDKSGGVSLQPADIEEPSLINLLAQFEITRILSVVFNESHDISHFESFAFGKKLVDILFMGMTGYNSPPFRAFVKMLMFHVCEVLNAAKLYPDGDTYDDFFMSTFARFCSDLKFAFSVLWVSLPYGKLSSKSRCKIISCIAGFSAFPVNNYLQHAKDFAVTICRLPLHDAAHLLNVCLMVAASTPEDDETNERMTETVVACVLFVCHMLPSASEVLWKVSRLQFLAFVSDRPWVINRVVEIISSHLSTSCKPGTSTTAVRSWLELSNMFKSINYSKFEPSDSTLSTIQYWLVHSDMTSGEYLLAKDIMANLNWSSRAPGLPPFLDQTIHHRAALMLLRWVARSSLPAGDRKSAWAVMLRLQLLCRNASTASPCPTNETAPFVKAGEPLACYAAFLMQPTVSSSVENFVSQGLPLVRTMLDKQCPNEAIHALLLALGDHYQRSAFEYLMGSKEFCDLIDRILTCSMVDVLKGWAFESSLPKDILAYGIVGHMRSMNAYMVLEFWLCILGRCSEGFQKSSVMDALELLLSLTPAVPDGLSTLNSVLSKHYSDFVESARKHASPVRAFVSWIVGLPFSLVQSSTQSTRWPWFCVASLSHDLQNEFETSFALRFHEHLLASPTSSLDKIYKQTMNSVEEDNKGNAFKQPLSLLPTSADNMAIFRLAQFVSQQASISHAATPLAWLLFFRAFLRKPSWTAKGCGYTLLNQQQASSKKQVLSSLVTALKSAVKAAAALSVVSNVAKECQELYSAMLLWLDEPRLHSANFDPKTLPPAFLPDIVTTLIDPSSDPWPTETLQLWLLRYVDLQEVADNIALFADKFKSLTTPVYSVAQALPAVESGEGSAADETKCVLAQYQTLPDFSQYSIRPLFPDITASMCRDLSSALQVLMVSLDAFRIFSSWVSEQQSLMLLAHEKIVETLPNLCTYETVEERINKPCSTFTSYLRPCSSPAVLIARYRRAKRLPSQEAAINQFAAQSHAAVQSLVSLMSPSSSQSPVQIAVAAIRLETFISKIVENCADAQDTGRSFYYTIATFIDNNPSMWQTAWDRFLSLCLEMLGQTFIRPCIDQQKAGRGCLLETIINSVNSDYVRRLMSSDFVPHAQSAPGLIEIMATAIAGRRISPDFAFTLISKFETKAWISELTVQQRTALVSGTLRCIISSLGHADFASHSLIDLLVCIIGVSLSYSFPDLLHPVIEQYVAFTDSYISCALPPSVWNMLLKKVLGSSDYNCPMLSVDGLLTLQIVDSELHYLAEIFSKARVRFETAQSWRVAVAPLSLIASRFYCLAVDRAVLVSRVTASAASSFDMFGMLMNVFGPLILPPSTPNQSFVTELRPSFAAFGDCLLHLQQASFEVRFAGGSTLLSRMLATYVQEMLEAAATYPTYAKEIHACLGRLQWAQFSPPNSGEVEILEMLCNRDGVSSFWTGTICSIDWKTLYASENFSSSESRTLLISSLVRMGYTSVVRYPRNSPIGDLVTGCLVDTIKGLDLEMLPTSVFTQLCADIRATNGRPLPPQVVFAWASDDSSSLQSLKDCVVYLEIISGGFNPNSTTPLTESTLVRSCEFIRLVGFLLNDCLTAELQQSSAQSKQSKQQQQQTSTAIARVVSAMLKRCELIIRVNVASSSLSFVAHRVCTAGLEQLNQSVAFANRILPAYTEYFSSSSSDKSFIVYWLSAACRSVQAATVAVTLAEVLLGLYRQFSPSFTWETAQTLVSFVSCQSNQSSAQPTAPPSSPNGSLAVSYSSNRNVQIAGMPTSYHQPNGNVHDKTQSPLDEFILLGGVAAANSALLVVQALARRAISAANTDNFDIRKATMFSYSDVLVRCCETPKSGDEVRLFGLWSLWLTELVQIESYLSTNGVSNGYGINSLAADLAFVPRLSTLVQHLTRLGEMRSSKGILGAIGLGSKSPLPPWFHLFVRAVACLITRHYPDCIPRSKSSGYSASGAKQMVDAFALLRSDREYANLSNLINALLGIVQDSATHFTVSVERLLGEFRVYQC